MIDHADAVSTVARILRLQAVTEQQAGEARKAEEFDSMAASLTRAAAEIARLRDMVSPLPPDIGDVKRFPQQLRRQLSRGRIDGMDEKIIGVISAYGGEADLDQILVGLYLKYEVALRRRYVQNKLYRLGRFNLVTPVAGTRGVFRTTRPPRPAEEVEKEKAEA